MFKAVHKCNMPQGSLGNTLKEVRPTIFFGVPRVWEKIQEKMVEIGKSNGPVKKKIAAWARDVGLRGEYHFMLFFFLTIVFYNMFSTLIVVQKGQAK